MARNVGVLPMMYTNEDEGADSGRDEAGLLSQGNSTSPLGVKFRLSTFPSANYRGCVLFSAIGMIALTVCTLAVIMNPFRQQPENPQQPIGPPKHLVASLRSSRQAVLLPPACDYNKVSYCPAQEALFDNPDTHSVVLENILKSDGQQIERNNVAIVKDIITSVFHNISSKFRGLEQLQINAAQKDAMINVLTLMRAPEVQNLGRNVIQMIHKAPNVDKTWLQWYIEDQLSASLPEIHSLAERIVPKVVVDLWMTAGNEWSMVLNPQNIFSVRANDFEDASKNWPAVDPKTLYFGIYGSALEQSRVLLDLLQSRSSQTTSVVRVADLLYEGIDWPTDMESLNFIEALQWPLKCGMHGIDALKASYSTNFGKYDHENHVAAGQLS